MLILSAIFVKTINVWSTILHVVQNIYWVVFFLNYLLWIMIHDLSLSQVNWCGIHFFSFSSGFGGGVMVGTSSSISSSSFSSSTPPSSSSVIDNSFIGRYFDQYTVFDLVMVAPIQLQCHWFQSLFRCRIETLNFSIGFNIIATYMACVTHK